MLVLMVVARIAFSFLPMWGVGFANLSVQPRLGMSTCRTPPMPGISVASMWGFSTLRYLSMITQKGMARGIRFICSMERYSQKRTGCLFM